MSFANDQMKMASRKRNILYLIDKFLLDEGFESISESLRKEAYLQFDYEICDNVDLDTIYLEYCSYYHMKFGRYPQIVKKINSAEKKSSDRRPVSKKKVQIKDSSHNLEAEEKADLSDSLKVLAVCPPMNVIDGIYADVDNLDRYKAHDADWQHFVDLVDFVKKSYDVKWSDVIGNSKAIAILKEAVEVPLLFPDLFSKAIKPWRAVLLHGPPGTGKTLIAKALCSETMGRVSFFNICSSTIISKWRGESEKLIKVVFEVAKYHAPSIIFVDEIEGITSRRDNASEHEASRRFKNEFLSLLDGLGNENKGIFVLANTNLPWQIDPAFLRRFEKRILVDLPKAEERIAIIHSLLPESGKWSNISLTELSEKSKGFTGDELRIACKEAAMRQVRLALASGKGNASSLEKVTTEDLLQAIDQIHPSGEELLTRHKEWSKRNGSS